MEVIDVEWPALGETQINVSSKKVIFLSPYF